MKVGTLELELLLNRTNFDRVFKEAERDAKRLSGKKYSIAPELDTKDIKGISNAVKTQVMSANRWLSANPIKPKVDLSEIERLNSLMGMTSGGTIKIDAEVKDSRGGNSDCCKDITRSIASNTAPIKDLLKEIAGNTKKKGIIGKTVGTIAQGAILGTTEAATRNFGEGISKGLERYFKTDFGRRGQALGLGTGRNVKRANNVADLASRELLGMPNGLKDLKRLTTGTMQGVYNQLTDPQFFKDLEELYVEMARQGFDISALVTDRGGLEKNPRIKAELDKFGDRFDKFVEDYVARGLGAVLRLGTQPIRINKRIGLEDSAKTALETADVYQQQYNSPEEKERIAKTKGTVYVIGGVQPSQSKPGEPNVQSTYDLANQVQAVFPESYVKASAPVNANSLETLESSPSVQLKKFILDNQDAAKDLLGNILPKEEIDQLMNSLKNPHPFDRMVQTNLQGFDEDAIKTSAEIIGEIKQNIEDGIQRDITIVSGSGGGHVAENVIGILNHAAKLDPSLAPHIARVRAEGQGTPVSGYTATAHTEAGDAKFHATIGDLDHVGVAYYGEDFINPDATEQQREQILQEVPFGLPSGVVSPHPDMQTVIPNFGFLHRVGLMTPQLGSLDTENGQHFAGFVNSRNGSGENLAVAASQAKSAMTTIDIGGSVNLAGKFDDRMKSGIEAFGIDSSELEAYRDVVIPEDVQGKFNALVGEARKSVDISPQIETIIESLGKFNIDASDLAQYKTRGDLPADVHQNLKAEITSLQKFFKQFTGLGLPAKTTGKESKEFHGTFDHISKAIALVAQGKMPEGIYSPIDTEMIDFSQLEKIANSKPEDISLYGGEPEALMQLWKDTRQHIFRAMGENFDKEWDDLISSFDKMAENGYQERFGTEPFHQVIGETASTDGEKTNLKSRFNQEGIDPSDILPRLPDFLHKTTGITKDDDLPTILKKYDSADLGNSGIDKLARNAIETFISIKKKEAQYYIDYAQRMMGFKKALADNPQDPEALKGIISEMVNSPFSHFAQQLRNTQEIAKLPEGMSAEDYLFDYLSGEQIDPMTPNISKKTQKQIGDVDINAATNFISQSLFTSLVAQIHGLEAAVEMARDVFENFGGATNASRMSKRQILGMGLDPSFESSPASIASLIKLKKKAIEEGLDFADFDISQATLLGNGYTGEAIGLPDKGLVVKRAINDYALSDDLIGNKTEIAAMDAIADQDIAPKPIAKVEDAFVMTSLPGKSLMSQLDNFDTNKVDGLLRRVGAMLAEIHKSGYTHNDFNTSNILYDPETDRLSAVDFANAKKLENQDDIDADFNTAIKRTLPGSGEYVSKNYEKLLRKGYEMNGEIEINPQSDSIESSKYKIPKPPTFAGIEQAASPPRSSNNINVDDVYEGLTNILDGLPEYEQLELDLDSVSDSQASDSPVENPSIALHQVTNDRLDTIISLMTGGEGGSPNRPVVDIPDTPKAPSQLELAYPEEEKQRGGKLAKKAKEVGSSVAKSMGNGVFNGLEDLYKLAQTIEDKVISIDPSGGAKLGKKVIQRTAVPALAVAGASQIPGLGEILGSIHNLVDLGATDMAAGVAHDFMGSLSQHMPSLFHDIMGKMGNMPLGIGELSEMLRQAPEEFLKTIATRAATDGSQVVADVAIGSAGMKVVEDVYKSLQSRVAPEIQEANTSQLLSDIDYKLSNPIPGDESDPRSAAIDAELTEAKFKMLEESAQKAAQGLDSLNLDELRQVAKMTGVKSTQDVNGKPMKSAKKADILKLLEGSDPGSVNSAIGKLKGDRQPIEHFQDIEKSFTKTIADINSLRLDPQSIEAAIAKLEKFQSGLDNLVNSESVSLSGKERQKIGGYKSQVGQKKTGLEAYQKFGDINDLIAHVNANISEGALKADRHWGNTTQEILKNFNILKREAKEKGYDIQKALSKGSPGMLTNLEGHWDESTKKVRSKLSAMAKDAENTGWDIQDSLSFPEQEWEKQEKAIKMSQSLDSETKEEDNYEDLRKVRFARNNPLEELEQKFNIPADKAQGHWKNTAVEILQQFNILAVAAKEKGYSIQKALSEGSPGITVEIRKNWKKTTEDLKSKFEYIRTQSQVAGSDIEQAFAANPDLLDNLNTMEARLDSFSNSLENDHRFNVAFDADSVSVDAIADSLQAMTINLEDIELGQSVTFDADTASSGFNALSEELSRIHDSSIDIRHLWQQLVDVANRFAIEIGQGDGDPLGGLENVYDGYVDILNNLPDTEDIFGGISSFIEEMSQSSPVFGQIIDFVKDIGISAAGIIGFSELSDVITKGFMDVVQYGREFQRFDRAMSAAGKNGKKVFTDLYETSQKYGTSLVESMAGYRQLSLSTQGTDKEAVVDTIFPGFQKAFASRQSTPEQQGRGFLAVEQMLSKGNASAEELRQQLSEALPGAFSIAAQAMGLDMQEFTVRLYTAQIASEELLTRMSAFYDAESAVLLEISSKSFEAELNRLTSNLQAVKSIAGSIVVPLLTPGLQAANLVLSLMAKNAELLSVLFAGILAGSIYKTVTAMMGVASATGLNIVLMKLFSIETTSMSASMIAELGKVQKAQLYMGLGFKKVIAGAKAMWKAFAAPTAVMAGLYLLFKLINSGAEEVKAAAKVAKTLAQGSETDEDKRGEQFLSGNALEAQGQYLKEVFSPSGLLKTIVAPLKWIDQEGSKRDVKGIEKSIKYSGETGQNIRSTIENSDFEKIKEDLDKNRADQSLINAQRRRAIDDSDYGALEGIEEKRARLKAEQQKILKPVAGNIVEANKDIKQLESQKKYLKEGFDKGDITQEKYERLTKNIDAKIEFQLVNRKILEAMLKGVTTNIVNDFAIIQENFDNMEWQISGELTQSTLDNLNAKLEGNISALDLEVATSFDNKKNAAKKAANVSNQVSEQEKNINSQSAFLKRSALIDLKLVKESDFDEGIDNYDFDVIFEQKMAEILNLSPDKFIKPTGEDATESDIALADFLASLGDLVQKKDDEVNSKKESAQAENDYRSQLKESAAKHRDFAVSLRDLARSLEDTAIERQRFAEDFPRQVEQAQIDISRAARGIKEQYQDFLFDLESQLIGLQLELAQLDKEIFSNGLDLDLKKQFGATQGTGREIAEAFNDYLKATVPDETIELEQDLSRLDLEKQTLENSRKIRDLNESRIDVEKDALEQMRNLQREQEDFNRQQKRTWEDTIKQMYGIELQAAEIGVSLDSIGGGVTEQGNNLIGALNEVSKAVFEQAKNLGNSINLDADESDIINSLRRAIIGKESGANFKAVNKDSGALGYGQVMPANVKSWSKQALGKSITAQEFLDSPKAQLKIINHKIKEYYQREIARTGGDQGTAVRRVASTWYSGRPNLYNNTAPQTYGAGKYPSIDAYTKDILNRVNKEMSTSASKPKADKPKKGLSKPDMPKLTYTPVQVSLGNTPTIGTAPTYKASDSYKKEEEKIEKSLEEIYALETEKIAKQKIKSEQEKAIALANFVAALDQIKIADAEKRIADRRSTEDRSYELTKFRANTKGYLTQSEEVSFTGGDVRQEFKSKIRELEDLNNELGKEIESLDKTLDPEGTLSKAAAAGDKKAIETLEYTNAKAIEKVDQFIANNKIKRSLKVEVGIAAELAEENKDIEIDFQRRADELGMTSELLEGRKSFAPSMIHDAGYNKELREQGKKEIDLDYDRQLKELDKLKGKNGEITDQYRVMKKTLDDLNAVKLEALYMETNGLVTLFDEVAQPALNGLLDDFIDKSTTASEAFKNFARSILDSIADILMAYAKNEALRLIFGGAGQSGVDITGKTKQKGGLDFGSILGAGANIAAKSFSTTEAETVKSSGFGLGEAAGLASQFIPLIFSEGGDTETMVIPYARQGMDTKDLALAKGLNEAIRKENHPEAFPAVLHKGEVVLSDLNGDAQLIRELRSTGEWNRMKNNTYQPAKVDNFRDGSEGAYSTRSTGGTTFIQNTPITVYAKDVDSFKATENQRARRQKLRMDRSKR